MAAKQLKAFVRLDSKDRVVPGSLIIRYDEPREGRWSQVGRSALLTNSSGSSLYLNGETLLTTEKNIVTGTFKIFKAPANISIAFTSKTGAAVGSAVTISSGESANVTIPVDAIAADVTTVI